MDSKDIYKQDLVKSFHEQFALNQNNHQTAFIQLLSIILSALIGFGYAFIKFNYKLDEKVFNLNLLDFTSIFVLSEIVLMFGLLLTLNFAYSFRRDQFVNAIIREKAEITEDSECYLGVFPVSFNPKKSFIEENKKHLSWMPDFHVNFAIIFITFQALIILGYFFKLIERGLLFNGNSIDVKSVIIFIFGVGFVSVMSVFKIVKYYKRIKKVYKI